MNQDKLDPILIDLIITNASNLLHDNEFKKTIQIYSYDQIGSNNFEFEQNFITIQIIEENLVEKNAIGIALSNLLFPRLNLEGRIMLMNYLNSCWKYVKLPLRHQLSISNNKAFLNLPINIDKETPMQIEDKVVLSNVNDAVAVATFKLNLTPAILFQSKCVNLIEQLSTFKNVFLVYSDLEKNF